VAARNVRRSITGFARRLSGVVGYAGRGATGPCRSPPYRLGGSLAEPPSFLHEQTIGHV
jgi:hypothetical protein